MEKEHVYILTQVREISPSIIGVFSTENDAKFHMKEDRMKNMSSHFIRYYTIAETPIDVPNEWIIRRYELNEVDQMPEYLDISEISIKDREEMAALDRRRLEVLSELYTVLGMSVNIKESLSPGFIALADRIIAMEKEYENNLINGEKK